jgi:hypothetical protein
MWLSVATSFAGSNRRRWVSGPKNWAKAWQPDYAALVRIDLLARQAEMPDYARVVFAHNQDKIAFVALLDASLGSTSGMTRTDRAIWC